MPEEKKYKCAGLNSWDIETWLPELGSPPVAVIADEDFSESYEINRMLVVKLKNQKYATILEVG